MHHIQITRSMVEVVEEIRRLNPPDGQYPVVAARDELEAAACLELEGLGLMIRVPGKNEWAAQPKVWKKA
jgi:hypothetical protein